jgi:TolB-like protein
MNHIKRIWFMVIIFLIINSALFAQQALTLDSAIRAAARDIENRLETGAKIVILNFRSPSTRFSGYVIDEIMTEFVNNGKLEVVDRANLALIRAEMNFQMTGEVSDASAQSIGRILGAQFIVSGSIEEMSGSYRMRFRVIAVETAMVQAMTSHNVRSDAQITRLMSVRDAPQVAAGQQPSTQPAAQQRTTQQQRAAQQQAPSPEQQLTNDTAAGTASEQQVTTPRQQPAAPQRANNTARNISIIGICLIGVIIFFSAGGRGGRTIIVRLITISVCIGLIFFASSLFSNRGSSSQRINTTYAYVNTDILNVRAGPSTSHEIVTGLSRGTRVQVIDSSGSWWKIRAGNVEGFVSSELLRRR